MGQAVTQLQQAAASGARSDADSLPTSFSLERAQRRSSNPALTAARYHLASAGGGGRHLHDDFQACQDVEVLGRGSNVEVVAVWGRTNQRKYALKSFFKPAMSQEDLGLLVNEIEIYLGLDHPHIARLEGVYETDTDVHVVMECCGGGELYERLIVGGALEEAEAAAAMRQMLRAVGYLHARGVAHRDLKLENLLYESTGSASPLKLVDFGLAWAWDPLLPVMQRCCGSPEYVSPEVLTAQGYTRKCDLWSLGVIAFMLLGGYAPFPRAAKQLYSVVGGRVDWSQKERWCHVSTEAVDFVQRLLVVDAEERLDVQQAIFHPWLLRTLGNHVHIPTLDAKVIRSLQLYATAPRVRRAGLQLLAQHLAPEETLGLREAFLGLDLGNEGVIRVRDLRHTLYKQRAPSAGLDELLDAIAALGDDAGVHFSEFLAAAAAQVVSEGAARAVFARLDAGGKGFIDAGDLEAALGPVVLEAVPGGAAELLREADPTGEFVFTGTLGFDAFLRVLQGDGGEGAGIAAPSPLAAKALAFMPGGLFSAARAALLGSVVAAVC